MITEISRECALELEALPPRIAQVRRIVSAKLRYWGLDPLIDPALLGITELLANVHRHARPDKQCSVELSVTDDWLTVSVSDSDPRLPQLRSLEPLSTCGRGLSMVAALSASWGCQPADEGGKVVWFTLRLGSAGSPVPSEPPLDPLPVAVAREPRVPVPSLA